ncbi:MAG: hypothetical protein JWO65_1318 [Sphingomonas bacterium]|jgi:hypothetical protein|nr:hypothetical protein [Sphingomonas bacterium]
MRVEDFEEQREPSAPIDMLESYFEAHGWTSERAGDDEIIATVQGSWTQYELRGVWRPEDRVLQFLAMPDIRVPADKRIAVYETIGLINEQLWLGHFELWAASGLALYRNATLIEGDGESVLSLDHAETLIETAIDECERFYPVFQFVLWSDKSPAEAIAAALIETKGEA